MKCYGTASFIAVRVIQLSYMPSRIRSRFFLKWNHILNYRPEEVSTAVAETEDDPLTMV